MDKIYRVKSRDKLGIIKIPSRVIDRYGHRSLTSVYLEDGTTIMVSDDDLEELDDWTEEIDK